MADWVIALLDSLDVKTACLIGHSQGCLVAIDAAARYPDRVSRLGLIAGALAIPVNDQLLTMSDKALGKAIRVMTSWGHGPMAHMHDNTQPGHSFLGYGNRLMASNHADALRHDLVACNNYSGGKVAAAKITQPTLCVLAASDRMTPVKFGNVMADSLVNSERVILNGAGHMLPAERPAEVNDALRRFLAS
jgi:pimeloyl-ACP methyl ester carboxylesterase